MTNFIENKFKAIFDTKIFFYCKKFYKINFNAEKWFFFFTSKIITVLEHLIKNSSIHKLLAYIVLRCVNVNWFHQQFLSFSCFSFSISKSSDNQSLITFNALFALTILQFTTWTFLYFHLEQWIYLDCADSLRSVILWKRTNSRELPWNLKACC